MHGASAPVQAAQSIDWDFPESSGADSIHAFHPYPAKFIPEIPRALIELFPPETGTCVLDPFCGCGTTLVEAQSVGLDAIGVDLNPIACLLSRIKTSPLPAGLSASLRYTVETAHAQREGEDLSSKIPNAKHWFRDDIARVLGRLRRAISQSSNECQPFLEAAFSAIVVRVSNQESDTRYAAIDKPVSESDVLRLFEKTGERLIALCEGRPPLEANVRVLQKDVRQLKPSDLRQPVGLTITSPPYPNAYEYWLYHKYRMYWLGHNPLEIKEKEIGARAHYFKKTIPTDSDFHDVLRDMLRVVFQRSVPQAYLCVVIGRSIIHGREVDNGKITTAAADSVGFRFITALDRTLNRNRKSFNLSHAKIAREDILIFKKP